MRVNKSKWDGYGQKEGRRAEMHSTQLPPRQPSVGRPPRPAGWPSEWVHLGDMPAEYALGPVSTTTSNAIASGPSDPVSQLVTVLDQSVSQTLFAQAYASPHRDMSGYLGGKWVPVHIPPSRAHPAGKWKLVCHVTHFYAAQRSLDRTIAAAGSGAVSAHEAPTTTSFQTEDDQSIESAVAKFKELKVECVGWYRTTDPVNPLQPSRADASKQALLQAIIPDGVGVLLSVASANNPNKYFPEVTRSGVGQALQAPSHSMIAFRSFVTKKDNTIEIEHAYPSLPAGDPRPYLKDLVYYKVLRAFTVPVGVRTEKYINAETLREAHRTLEMTLEESRRLHLVQEQMVTTPGEKNALALEYDRYLLDFCRQSIGGAEAGLTQELRKLDAQKRWVMKDIQKITREMKSVWTRVIKDYPGVEKIADFEDVVQDLMEKKAKEFGLEKLSFEKPSSTAKLSKEDDKGEAIKTKEGEADEAAKNESTTASAATTDATDEEQIEEPDVYLLKGLTRIAMELENNTRKTFVVPTIQPDLVDVQDSLLYEEDLYDISATKLRKAKKANAAQRKRKLNEPNTSTIVSRNDSLHGENLMNIKEENEARRKNKTKSKTLLAAEAEIRRKLHGSSSVQGSVDNLISAANSIENSNANTTANSSAGGSPIPQYSYPQHMEDNSSSSHSGRPHPMGPAHYGYPHQQHSYYQGHGQYPPSDNDMVASRYPGRPEYPPHGMVPGYQQSRGQQQHSMHSYYGQPPMHSDQEMHSHYPPGYPQGQGHPISKVGGPQGPGYHQSRGGPYYSSYNGGGGGPYGSGMPRDPRDPSPGRDSNPDGPHGTHDSRQSPIDTKSETSENHNGGSYYPRRNSRGAGDMRRSLMNNGDMGSSNEEINQGSRSPNRSQRAGSASPYHQDQQGDDLRRHSHSPPPHVRGPYGGPAYHQGYAYHPSQQQPPPPHQQGAMRHTYSQPKEYGAYPGSGGPPYGSYYSQPPPPAQGNVHYHERKGGMAPGHHAGPGPRRSVSPNKGHARKGSGQSVGSEHGSIHSQQQQQGYSSKDE